MGSARTQSRVVVTGLGTVTAVGQTVAELMSALREGRTGIKPITRFYQNHPSFLDAGAVKDFDIRCRIAAQVDPFEQRKCLLHVRRDKVLPLADRFSLFAAAAAHEAMSQAGLSFPMPNPAKVGCIVGTSEGGTINIDAGFRHIFETSNPASHPLTLLRIIGSSAAAHLGIEYGMKGPVFGVCGACASGGHAISVARGYIRHDNMDVMLAGGAEAPIAPGSLRFWEAAGLLSSEGLHSFAATRSGTVLGEGAGLVVLESLDHARARGATILGELVGAAATASATDMQAFERDGMADAIKAALDDASLRPEMIDAVLANGSGINEADMAEAGAIASVFGEKPAVAVTAARTAYGNALAAGCGIDAAIAIRAIAEQWVPPTVGVAAADPAMGLDLVTGSGRSQSVRYVMANGFAVSGLNVSLILGPPPVS